MTSTHVRLANMQNRSDAEVNGYNAPSQGNVRDRQVVTVEDVKDSYRKYGLLS